MPSSGPCAMLPNDMDNIKTDPIFSTTNTNATQIAPKMTTTLLMMYFVCDTVNGFFTKGLKKSSNMTADMELRPVESDDNAAENTPATNMPTNPGELPNKSITSSGNN